MSSYEQMDTYQEDAKTFDFHPTKMRRIMTALGMAAEAGETAGKIYKLIRDDQNVFELETLTPEKRHAIALELGDVLWFLSMLADTFGYSLSDIAEMNIEKLTDRMQRGVTTGSGDYR